MPDRAWILLPSDHRLDLLAPDPETWTDEDLAIGLSRTFRRAGYSAWDPPLSVAQHSLTVLALRARMPGPSTDLGLTLELLDTDLLTLPVGMRPWKPWPPRVPRRTSRSGSGCFRRREKARTGGAITHLLSSTTSHRCGPKPPRCKDQCWSWPAPGPAGLCRGNPRHSARDRLTLGLPARLCHLVLLSRGHPRIGSRRGMAEGAE